MTLAQLKTATFFDDYDIIEALADYMREFFRVLHPSLKPYYWNGAVWVEDSEKLFFEDYYDRFIAALRTIADDPATVQGAELKKASVRLNRPSYRPSNLRQLLRHKNIMITEEEKNKYANIASFKNFFVDLTTGQKLKHDSGQFVTIYCPYEYKGIETFDKKSHVKMFEVLSENAPKFAKFIAEVAESSDPGDIEETRKRAVYLWGTIGQGLMQNTSQGHFYIWWGAAGRNGKGATMQIVETAFPYSCDEADEDLVVTNTESTPTIRLGKRHTIMNKRLVTVAETHFGARLDATFLLKVTGGNKVDAKDYYAKPYSGTPDFQIIIQTNKLPHARDLDNAMRERLRMLQFHHYYERADRVNDYGKMLLDEEGAYIVTWLVHCGILLNDKIIEMPESYQAETNSYIKHDDEMGTFIRSILLETKKAYVACEYLYGYFKEYGTGYGMGHIGYYSFVQRLKNMNLPVVESNWEYGIKGYEVNKVFLAKFRENIARITDGIPDDRPELGGAPGQMPL